MRRKKRFTIRLVALGFAAAALGAPAAQAMPQDMTGVEARGLHETKVLVARADRTTAPHGASYSAYSRVAPRVDDSAAPPQIVEETGGFAIGSGTISGIVLLVAVGGATTIALREARKGKLASA